MNGTKVKYYLYITYIVTDNLCKTFDTNLKKFEQEMFPAMGWYN